jgi:hypothetical protein
MVAVLVVVYVVVGVATGSVVWTAARQVGRSAPWSTVVAVWFGVWWPGTLAVCLVRCSRRGRVWVDRMVGSDQN